MLIRYMLLVCFSVLVGSLSPPTSAAEVPQADPDNALVVFYRVKAFKGGAIRFNVHSSEGLIGTLGSGTYLYKRLEPGQYQFWSQVISQDSITLSVDAGKTYYVKAEANIGVFAGRPKFTQVSESQAKSDIANL